MRNRGTKYWIIMASKDHVKNGVADGIAQACHGKAGPLNKMNKGDFIIYYSGKQNYMKPEKCQKFTAIGEVKDHEVYPFQITEDFCPYRRKITFFESRDTPISPLIDNLAFIKNKQYWGYRFRYGFFEINKQDFDLIACQMLTKSYA